MAPDARTLLNIVSNCQSELRICAYELGQTRWTHSLQLDGGSPELGFEGVLSPSILVQRGEHLTLQASVNLHWGELGWMVNADIGQSDDRDEDSYHWLWQAAPVHCESLDVALRALAQATGELIAALKNLEL